jgi:hypothetical protein
MNKHLSKLVTLAALVLIAVGTCVSFAGNSGVENEVGPFTQSGGKFLKDKIESTLDSVVEALDASAVETGSVTNGQVVVLTGTYTVAPVVLLEGSHATSNSYATSISTTGFTAVTPSTTNKYVVIAVQ